MLKRFLIGFCIIPIFAVLCGVLAWLIKVGGLIAICVLIFLACVYCGIAAVKIMEEP